MMLPERIVHGRYRVIYTVDERPGCTVFRARDEQTNRLVLMAALAVAAGDLADVQLLVRQVATVRHAMILPVLDHFAEGEQYFVVCEDLSGQDVERTLRARGTPFAEDFVLGQAQGLLGALEHIHSQRPALFLGDLLASDLLVGDTSEWRLTPFALVRPIGSGPSPYRAPELDIIDAEPTPTSDLYAFTAMLYQTLTGWAPPTTAQRQAGTPLTGPRSLNPQLSSLAEQVLLRGLQLKPENRYQLPAEMRMSLDMVKMMAGRSLGADAPTGAPANMQSASAPPATINQPLVLPPTPATQPAPAPAYGSEPALPSYQPAQPPSMGASLPLPAQPYQTGVGAPEPARRSGFRTGCLVTIALLLALSAIAICAALAWFLPGSPLPALLGFEVVPSAVATTSPAPTSAPATAPDASAPTSAAGVTPAAGALPALEPLDLGVRAITLENASTITQTREITGAELGPVAFSPDGKAMAVGISSVIQLRDPQTLNPTNPPVLFTGHTGKLFTLAYAPDSKLLASGAIDENTVRVWDAATGQQLRVLSGHSGWIRIVAFSPDGKTLASGSFDTSIKLWDPATGQLLRTLQGHEGFISTVAFSPDGRSLASSASDGTVQMWDVASGAKRDGFAFEPAPNLNTGAPLWTTGLSFSPDGKTLAVGSEDGSIVLVDAATGIDPRTLRGHTGIVVSRGLAFSPDGKTLASGSFDGTVRLWDVASGAQRSELRAHGLRVLSLAFSPDGAHVASTSDQGGQLILWNVASGEAERSLQVGQGLITALHFSPDSNILGAVGYNGTTRLHLLNQNSFRTLAGSAQALNSLAFLSNTRAASISDEGDVALLDLSAGNGEILQGLQGKALNLVASADGKLLVAGSDTGAITRWNGTTGEALPALTGGQLPLVYGLAVSPDGALIAAAGPARVPRIEIWDAAGGKLLHTLGDGGVPIAAMAFQPRGNLLGVATIDGTLQLWDARAGMLAATINAPAEQGRFSTLAFSPDGTLLVTGAPTGDITFWDARNAKRVAALPALDRNRSGVFTATFSADGAQVAFGLGDQTVHLLALPPGR